jgi:hypothetical protein
MAVIPGPPQAEPGNQKSSGHGRLDSGFAQERNDGHVGSRRFNFGR